MVIYNISLPKWIIVLDILKKYNNISVTKLNKFMIERNFSSTYTHTFIIIRELERCKLASLSSVGRESRISLSIQGKKLADACSLLLLEVNNVKFERNINSVRVTKKSGLTRVKRDN